MDTGGGIALAILVRDLIEGFVEFFFNIITEFFRWNVSMIYRSNLFLQSP